jgi:hypothetical protein
MSRTLKSLFPLNHTALVEIPDKVSASCKYSQAISQTQIANSNSKLPTPNFTKTISAKGRAVEVLLNGTQAIGNLNFVSFSQRKNLPQDYALIFYNITAIVPGYVSVY